MERLTVKNILKHSTHFFFITILFLCSIYISAADAATLTEDTIWSAGEHTLTESITVSNGITLRIEAGAVVNFAAGLQISVQAGGRLNIVGDEVMPVILTSLNTIKGAWSGIFINGERTNSDDIQISHAIIEYASFGVRFEEGSKGDINNAILRHNMYAIYYNGKRTGGNVNQSDIHDNTYGVYIHGGKSYVVDHPKPIINNNNIYNNSGFNYYARYFYDQFKMVLNAKNNWWGTTDLTAISNNIYDINNYTYSPSIDYSGILLSENGSVTQQELFTANIVTDTTWTSSDAVLVQSLTVESGATLTIASDTYINVLAGKKLTVKAGAKLIIQGNAQQPVTFTSQGMVANSWQGIYIKGERVDNTDIVIENTIIEYANYGLRFEEGAKGRVAQSSIRFNTYALYFNGKRTGGEISNNLLHGNKYGAYLYGNGAYQTDHTKVIFHGNQLFDNTSYNLFVQNYYDVDKYVIDATRNWWGSIDLATIAISIYDNADYANSLSVDFSNILLSPDGEPSMQNILTSRIATNTTWAYTNAILAQSIKVAAGVTLTIAAGTNIEAVFNSQLIVQDGGKLLIQGSELSPVILTAKNKSKGGWRGIIINGERVDGSDVVINNAVIEYATYGVQLMQGSKANISHTVIRENTRGLYYSGKRTGGLITHCEIYNNTYGLYIDGSWGYQVDHPAPVVINNQIYNNSSFNYYSRNFYDVDSTVLNATNNWWGTTELNVIASKIYDGADNSNSPSVDYSAVLSTANGAAIAGDLITTNITQDTIWSGIDVIMTQPIKIKNGAILTIAAGAVIEGAVNSQLVVEEGAKLFVQGSVAEPVTFSGQNNTAGSWTGISIKGERNNNSDVQISHAVIEYASYGILLNTKSEALISDTTFKYNSMGVMLYADSKVNILRATMHNNTYGLYYNGKLTGGTIHQSQIYDNSYGVYINGGNSYQGEHPSPVITHNSFYNNSFHYYARYFYDADNSILDATNNWWGTTDLSIIATKIYDINDYYRSPNINYRQFLSDDGAEPITGTQYLGTISDETRWQSDDGLVLATTNIMAGGHLIIDAGSNVKFAKGSQLIVNKNARLTIVGDKQRPIKLTSNEPTKNAGDWKGIMVKAENGAVNISHATIEYANQAIAFLGKKSTGQVIQNKIQHNNYGLYVYGYGLGYGDHPTPTVTNNTFIDNNSYHYASYAFGSAGSRTLNARGNYWDTIDTALIAQKIYDNSDTSGSPVVDFGFSRSSDVFDVEVNVGADLITFATLNTELSGTAKSNVAIANTQWQQYIGEVVTVNNANSLLADFTAPDIESEQLLSFSLTITDENDISATDNLAVIVKTLSEYNKAPIVAESQELLIIGGDEVIVSLPATDSDNDPLTYTWQQVSGDNITLLSTNTDTLLFSAPESVKNKLYLFKLTVEDGHYVVVRNVQVAVKPPTNIAGTYYYHNDHLGTPQLLTDNNATVVWQANYTPFGQADVVVEIVTNNIRFPGQYYDQESGLHYNYFRDYDPELGRYIQSDPIGLAGGINTYGYVGGNPISYYDPLGLLKWTGSVTNFSASFIVGSSISFYELTSECVDGKKATINVTAVGPALGAGAAFGGSWSDISFEDRNPNDIIDPNRFNGTYISITATLGVVAPGITMGPHKLGKAITTKDSLIGMPKLSYDASAVIAIGSSTVMDTSYSTCGCEK